MEAFGPDSIAVRRWAGERESRSRKMVSKGTNAKFIIDPCLMPQASEAWQLLDVDVDLVKLISESRSLDTNTRSNHISELSARDTIISQDG